MLKPFLVLLQRNLLGATRAGEEARSEGYEIQEFSTDEDWRSRLDSLDRHLSASRSHRPVLFVSLDVARFVARRCPALRRGLLLDPEKLQVHRWSGFLPEDRLLNRSFILLPFGTILGRKGQLKDLFGSRIFLRPNSSMKEFPGQPMDISEIEQEISALQQIFRPDPDLLCVIDRCQDLPVHEYRFWVADGKILSVAPYALGPGGVHEALAADPCPEAMITMAADLAARLEMWENPVVMDLCLDGAGIPRLVEINGFSTSGFYPGVDLPRILSGLQDILVDDLS